MGLDLLDPALVGVAGSVASCDFTDDFTSYADQTAADAVYPYDDEGTIVSKVNVSSNLIECVYPAKPGSSDNFLGTCTRQTNCNTDDEAWVLRFTNSITNHAQLGGVSTRNFIGMCDLSYTSSKNVTQSAIGIFSQVQATINAYKTAGVFEGEITGEPSSTFSTFVPTQGDTDYVEIIRTSSTSFTVEAFANSNYTGSIEAESDSPSELSSVTGLDFLSFKGGESRTGSALTTEIPDVAFANAVTVYPS